MKICPQCHKEFADEINFCGSCGVKLVFKPRFCGKCGNPIKPNDKFCGKCGAMIDSAFVGNRAPEKISLVRHIDADESKGFLKGIKTRLSVIRENISGDAHFNETVENLDRIFADINSPLQIVVTGEASAGKSTFINALIGKKILPTGVPSTISITTKLLFGSSESITVHFIDGTQKSCTPQAFKHIASDNSIQFAQLRQKINYIEYAVPCDILKSMSVIDGADLNNADQKQLQTVERFLDTAGAVMWIISARNGLSAFDTSGIEQAGFASKPVVIVNQIDALADKDAVEELIPDLQSRLRGKVKTVIGLSSRLTLDGKLNRNPQLLRDSNFSVFNRFLSKTLVHDIEKYKANAVLAALSTNIDAVASSSDSVDQLTELSNYVQTLCFNPKLVDEDIANLFVGARYMSEKIPGNDLDRARIYLEKSAVKGNAFAQTFLTLLHFRKNNFTEAKRWSEPVNNRRFINKNLRDMQAIIQYLSGLMYYEGTVVAVDKSKAITLIKKSAEGGCTQGKYYLAVMLLKGEDVSYDAQEGIRLLKEAADEGDKNAPVELYAVYQSGKYGITKNATEACRWAEKIADDENLLNAMPDDQRYTLLQYLGFNYFNGEGLETDYVKANFYLVQAAAGGKDYAQYVLGCNYLVGRGCEQNTDKGLSWIKQSAAQGNEYAIQELQQLEQANVRSDERNPDPPPPRTEENSSSIDVGDVIDFIDLVKDITHWLFDSSDE